MTNTANTNNEGLTERLDENLFKLENAKSGLLVLALDESVDDKSVPGAIHAVHDLIDFALKDIRAAMAEA